VAAKLYLDEQNLRTSGVSEENIRTLRSLTAFVDTQNQLAEAQQDLADQGDAIDDANTDIATANGAINALDSRIDAYDALAPFVRQNQAANPSHTPFGTFSASNPPTQAEVQSIIDALVSQSATMATLLTRLDTVNLLT
jgi:hypothetical protein